MMGWKRQNLIAFALTARTPEQIEQATQALHDWLRQHPEDHSLEDACEVLFMRQPTANFTSASIHCCTAFSHARPKSSKRSFRPYCA